MLFTARFSFKSCPRSSLFADPANPDHPWTGSPGSPGRPHLPVTSHSPLAEPAGHLLHPHSISFTGLWLWPEAGTLSTAWVRLEKPAPVTRAVGAWEEG